MVAIGKVAERAGVSAMSVSRVLNDSPLVNDATRQRVLQAMRDLNYAPSAAARSLRRGRTKLLGVLVPDTNNPVYSFIADGINATAYEAGYCAIVCKPRADAGMDYIRLLREQRVAGAIFTSGWHPDIPPLLQAGITMVSYDQRSPNLDSVLFDNLAAARLAVEHLVELGHRRIAIITSLLALTSERGRMIGYRRAMRRAGLPFPRQWQGICDLFTDESAQRVAAAMLAAPERPSALIVGSSELTMGTLAAIAAAGLRIPEDIALVNIGELSWRPGLVSPLTTIVQPAYEMGMAACTALLERIDGRYAGTPRRLVFSPELVIRHSCGARHVPPALAMNSLSPLPLAGPPPDAPAIEQSLELPPARACSRREQARASKPDPVLAIPPR